MQNKTNILLFIILLSHRTDTAICNIMR